MGCLWWLRFDQIDESAVEHAYAGGIRELLTGFAWGCAHPAIFAGLTAVAVDIELAIGERQPRDE